MLAAARRSCRAAAVLSRLRSSPSSWWWAWRRPKETEGGRFFANRVTSDPKWVVFLATRLELVFRCQNTVRDAFLAMGSVIGDNLREKLPLLHLLDMH